MNFVNVYVSDYRSASVPGCLIQLEGIVFGAICGVLLGKRTHPAIALVGGVSVWFGYTYLFTLRRIGLVMSVVATLFWTVFAFALGKDWIWGALFAVVAAFISWKAHREGGKELRDALQRNR